MVGPKALLIRFTAVALGLVVGGLVGEISVRVYASFDKHAHRVLLRNDPLAVLISAHGEFGYRPRPNSVFRYGNGTSATTNSLGYRGPVVRTPKPSGTFRIILLGESTTHGWGVVDDETIDAYLRSLLRERYPDRSVDVVNLAFDGYDARQLLERLRSDGMRFEPDLIIVNAGINDVRNTRFKDLGDPDPRTLFWEGVLQRLRKEQTRGGPTVWTRMKHYSYLARLPAVARENLTARTASHTPTEQMTPNLEAADIFERNLGRIAALASQANIPVIFSTPPSSLSVRYKPEATSTISYWVVDAATTQRLRDELARRMQRVVANERSQCHQVAYIPHRFAADMFLDDAHLTSSGNRQMAFDFVDAIATYMEARLRPPRLKVEHGVCR